MSLEFHTLAHAGITLAVSLSAIGAAYGNAQTGISICTAKTYGVDSGMKKFLPVIMIGMLSIYGLVISMFILQDLKKIKSQTISGGIKCFTSGLICGLCSLSSGVAIGKFGNLSIRNFHQKLFFAYILTLIFCEMNGLFGLVVSIVNQLRKTY